jgi:hypothetical protein
MCTRPHAPAVTTPGLAGAAPAAHQPSSHDTGLVRLGAMRTRAPQRLLPPHNAHAPRRRCPPVPAAAAAPAIADALPAVRPGQPRCGRQANMCGSGGLSLNTCARQGACACAPCCIAVAGAIRTAHDAPAAWRDAPPPSLSAAAALPAAAAVPAAPLACSIQRAGAAAAPPREAALGGRLHLC